MYKSDKREMEYQVNASLINTSESSVYVYSLYEGVPLSHTQRGYFDINDGRKLNQLVHMYENSRCQSLSGTLLNTELSIFCLKK